MAWNRPLLDPMHAYALMPANEPTGLLEYNPYENAGVMTFWGFGPNLLPSMPSGYATPLDMPPDPWLDPPALPGASRAPIPWPGTGFYPLSNYVRPLQPLPYDPRDRAVPMPLPYNPEHDCSVPMPLPYYPDRDRGLPTPLAYGAAASELERARGLLDPSHWTEADGEHLAGPEPASREEGRRVEDLARRLGLDPEEVARIGPAPALLLANVAAYRDLDDDARQGVDERLRTIVEESRGRGGDPHAFGTALLLQQAIKDIDSPESESGAEQTEESERSAWAPDLRPRRPSPDELLNMPYEFYPSPPEATDEQARVLEELLRRPDIDERTKSLIRDYLDDRKSGRDRLRGPDEWMDDRGRFHRVPWPQSGPR